MTGQKIGQRIQDAFDWMRDVVTPVENRWIILTVTVGAFLLIRALGAQGLSEIVALVYIMYWVTLRGPRSERDE
jgi:hypothetical protein